MMRIMRLVVRSSFGIRALLRFRARLFDPINFGDAGNSSWAILQFFKKFAEKIEECTFHRVPLTSR